MSQRFVGIRAPMHPAWLCRSSVKYSRYSPSSALCHPGASTLSVRNNFCDRTLA